MYVINIAMEVSGVLECDAVTGYPAMEVHIPEGGNPLLCHRNSLRTRKIRQCWKI
jgi:hypothetical protein